MSTFKEVGAGYVDQLSKGLSLTGEPATYFASRRVERLLRMTSAAGMLVKVILDFGCGSGVGFASLRAAFPRARIVGFEPEPALRAVAEDAATASRVELLDDDTMPAMNDVDVAYCNGVFHHIPVPARAGAMRSLSGALRRGGLACIWENSPFNPGTRWVMSRIPFDRDAVLLAPKELRALQEGSGLTHVATEFHFVFPRALAFLRPFENIAQSLPLGGQYVCIARAS